MKNCCKNCVWCRWIYLYEEGASPVIDYCEKNECKIEDIEASCWRFEKEGCEMSLYNGEIEGEIVAAPTGSISACAPNASTCAAPTGSISACAPNASTCAANPIHQSPLTYEMIVDCYKELKDIQQSEIDNFDNIVKLFEDKNALLTECLYFLSAFVDDDFCYSLKQRVEKNLGIRFKRKEK